MHTMLYSLWLMTLISCEVKACGYSSWLVRTRLVTASVGDDAIFNYLSLIDGNLSYFVEWGRRIEEKDTAILAWNETDLIHTGTDYEGRAFRVSNTSYGVTAFNLRNITNSDRGEYTFTLKKDSDYPIVRYYYLLVNVPPYFIKTSPKNIFAGLGDKIVLTCKTEGIPLPEIFWYKDSKLVNSSATFDLFTNDMELGISNISHEDVGTYTCVAQNGEEDQNLQTSHTMKMFLTTILTNLTKLEGESVEFLCDIKSTLENDTVKWFRDGVLIEEISFLKERVERRANSLFINSVNSSDSGQYSCQVSNGVVEPRSTSTYLIVKNPPTKTSISSVQYLPLGLSGMLHCSTTNASISRMNVAWTKDKRFLEPSKNIVIMKNASVFFAQVDEHHEGLYTCTDWYKVKVLVRKPPTFTITPKEIYHGKLGEIMSVHCDAEGGNGMQKPTIQWKRQDGRPLLETTVKTNGGTLTFRKLGYFDFGFYQCVASNEVTTIVTTTLVTVSDTPPQPPFNLNGDATESKVTLSWTPGYGFGFSQSFEIRYREAGVSEWNTTYAPFPGPRNPRNQIKIKKLSSGTFYDFKVYPTNTIGRGMSSEIISVQTQEE